MKMENIKKNNVKFARGIIVCIGIITLLFSIIRCFLGIDIGDETLYISDPFIVAHGSTPFVDNWFATPGFSFFLAPIVAIYEFFVPTHQGIFLFMRIFFLIAKILIYVGIGILFRNTQYRYVVMLTSIPIIPYFFGVIPAFNYTNIPLVGVLCAGLLLLYQCHLKKGEKVLPIIVGIILACSTLCSPTQILNCFIFLLFYYFCINKEACCQYLLGGIGTALFFSVYMIVKAGSLAGFIHSLEILLNNPYFSFGPSTISWQLYNIFPLVIGSVILYVVCVGGMELLRRWRKKNNSFIWSCKIGLAIGALLGLIYNLVCHEEYSLWNRAIGLLAIGSFCFRFLPANKGLHKLFDFVVIPEIIAFLGMMFTVYGGAAGRFFVFVPMALICIIYIYDALKDYYQKGIFYLTVIYVCLFLCVTFKYEVKTIYGEFADNGQCLSVGEMNARVKEGIYKGVYTTEEKAVCLQNLEMYIRANTSEDEYVLFMDRVPMAYLMTDAEPCSSTSWDPQLYTEGYRGDTTMLEDYFEAVNRTPDKIIYVQTDSNQLPSIENDDYKFNDYVNENYCLKETQKIEDSYRVLIYERN